jgi:MarR family 2-MHQ and catechol resistance regulon transcriptional repressor
VRRKNELINTVLEVERECLLQRQGMSLEADISPVDFAVIDTLEAEGKISCNELSKKMKLSASRCSRIIDRLQRKGYIMRKQNPRDRRAVEVSLTEKGMRLKNNVERLKARCEKRIFNAIEPDNIEIVKKGMKILRNALHLQ